MANPPFRLYPVMVEKVQSVTPRLRRITINGRCLATTYREGVPAQWLKVFVPTDDETDRVGRAYTIRRFDAATGALDMDFVLHGDAGPASNWAMQAKAGDRFEISDPHPRGGVRLEPHHTHYLMFGDETALPAIASILEALPATTRADVFVEIEDQAEEQRIESAAAVNVDWLCRDGRGANSRLVEAARAISAPGPETLVFLAAESSIVQSIRRHAVQEWRIARENLHAAGYWKRGDADHRDEEATA
ncbi:siderophore-interacting protein [Aureimonas sp. OT7]|uniref:siderophore-interacting protein n=1 Tax=Aureimonas sp. OT7 TaxID=2816454 RepID=UPI001783D592|nr:siderophore-interacting protein [Aureimonas sp. OT7]QOG07400.1 siderophore-interacting protein [Aureimonas sp. OT7]